MLYGSRSHDISTYRMMRSEYTRYSEKTNCSAVVMPIVGV